MPLVPGSGADAISKNIRELTKVGGRPRKQIIAIALSKARRNAGTERPRIGMPPIGMPRPL